MIDIKLFGPTIVTIEGTRLDAAALGGVKPRQILEMLAAEVGTPLAKDRLAEGLWEGEPPASYLATLESYVCVLRRGLGIGKRSALVTTHRGYLLDPDRVQVDLMRFKTLMQGVLSGPQALAVERAERAMALATGNLLADDPYDAWAIRQRDDVARLVAAACTEAATIANDRGDSVRAIRLARLAADQGVLAEAPWQALMLALWRSGRRAEALRAYADLRAATLDELGVEPGPVSQDLYLAILRGDDQVARTAGGVGERHEIGTLVRLLRQALESGGGPLPGVETGLIEGLRGVLLATA
jgi:DNA-binding SARP family transcriptional activator